MPPPPAVLIATEGQLDALASRQASAVQAVWARLDVARQRLLAEMAQVDPQRVAQALTQLSRVVQATATQFRDTTAPLLVTAQGDMVELGMNLVDQALGAAIRLPGMPQLTMPLFDTLTAYSADLVTNLSDALRSRVTQEVQLTALGTQTPSQAMEKVARLLQTGESPGNIAARSEAIVRTETGRVHSMATQRRQEQAARSLPDLMKEWLHGGSRNPRSGHVAAHGQRVPVDEPFMVATTVGGRREPLMYPRDPAASAAQSVHCRCDSVPYLARWDEEAAA